MLLDTYSPFLLALRWAVIWWVCIARSFAALGQFGRGVFYLLVADSGGGAA
jgi:hypothetical protein